MKLNKGPGHVITFYSYKGGTGRSMALANVAWILASQGRKVLMVDWDLEAPGLHRYFHPFLEDKNLTSSDGIIDLVMKFERAAIAPDRGKTSGADPAWYHPFAEIDDYCIPLAWSFPEGGALDLLPAGKQGRTYAARVNSFNWSTFYDRLGGGVFLEAVKNNMRRKYDYILIDSRTGVSDTAGICTVQMPNTVVVCFTFNIQSIEGAAAVASSIRSQRERAAGGDQAGPAFRIFRHQAEVVKSAGAALRIFPVPMRVDRAEKEQLERARDLARSAFAGFLDHLPPGRTEQYWGEISVPYESFYAYQEILATVIDEPGVRDSVLTSLERLTEFVTDEVLGESSSLTQQERQDLKQLFVQGAQPRNLPVILSNHPDLEQLCEEVTTAQLSWTESREEGYLLGANRVAELREHTELMVAMLEDRAFREFWDSSMRKLKDAAIRQALVIRISVVGLLTIALIGDLISKFYFLPSSTFAGALLSFAGAMLGGALGAAASEFLALTTAVAVPGRKIFDNLPKFVLGVQFGAMAGIVTLLLIEDSLKVTSDARAVAIAFLAGFVSQRLVPDMIIKSMTVERTRGRQAR